MWNMRWLDRLSGSRDDKFIASTWFDVFDELVTPKLKKQIKFNTEVTKIDYSNDKIAVTTANDTSVKYDKVLLTVPITVLQKGAIEFTPALPAVKMTQIRKERMTPGLKVFLKFSKKFYPDLLAPKKCSNLLLANHLYYDAALHKKSKNNVLGLIAEGDAAMLYLQQKDRQALVAYVVRELDEIFEEKASKYLQKSYIQNWTAEPYIAGTYSHGHGDAKVLAAPVNNKLFFAGEAMNTNGSTIVVHGACESAYAAVDQILN